MTVRQLTEKKANLFNQMQDVYNAAEKENRSVTAEELAKVEAIEADLSATERQLRNLQAFQARKKEMEDGQNAVLETRNGREKIDAFNQYLRRGAYGMDPRLKPYLQRGTNPQTTSDTAGGYTIPEGWLGELDVAKKICWNGGRFSPYHQHTNWKSSSNSKSGRHRNKRRIANGRNRNYGCGYDVWKHGFECIQLRNFGESIGTIGTR
jgi:hypothetical protein